MPVFAETCVQDVVSLFGSQEEGELGSAARHLPGVRKVCRRRPDGEELGAWICLTAAVVLIWSRSHPGFPQSHKVSVVKEDQLEGV